MRLSYKWSLGLWDIWRNAMLGINLPILRCIHNQTSEIYIQHWKQVLLITSSIIHRVGLLFSIVFLRASSKYYVLYYDLSSWTLMLKKLTYSFLGKVCVFLSRTSTVYFSRTHKNRIHIYIYIYSTVQR